MSSRRRRRRSSGREGESEGEWSGSGVDCEGVSEGDAHALVNNRNAFQPKPKENIFTAETVIMAERGCFGQNFCRNDD